MKINCITLDSKEYQTSRIFTDYLYSEGSQALSHSLTI
uniref:Uncharacterized protein n=1 Tax=Rhizophora mucronata TaxID=61149 RepID=A0A2P2QEA6_RHIMU